jgi:uncharacterized protein (DUF488 family)
MQTYLSCVPAIPSSRFIIGMSWPQRETLMVIIFAIGHSTRRLSEFVSILQAHSVNLLVDIRTIPKSRHNPQFNQDFLRKKLQAKNIRYVHLKELGGLRYAAKDSVNKGWRNPSFRGFADYMQTEAFSEGLRKLIELGKEKKVAMMCAEGNPFRCHRSLVADALTIRKVKVFHISSRTSAREHVLTKFAVVKGKKITYPGG